MNSFIPANDLDRAIMSVSRSQASTPELYRQLIIGELWFLVPYHPEAEGSVIEIKNGSPLPFVLLRDEEGEVVPLFSSAARVEEGLKKSGLPKCKYSTAVMPARQVLEVLGLTSLRAVVNKSCGTGELLLPADLMRDLANGRALAPIRPGKEEEVHLKKLDPADYPTNLIQPVFEFIRGHGNFRAAWVFGLAEEPGQPANQSSYCLIFLMQPRDEILFHDVNMVVQAARPKTGTIRLTLLDETDEDYIAEIFRLASAFYTASDYRPPSGAVG